MRLLGVVCFVFGTLSLALVPLALVGDRMTRYTAGTWIFESILLTSGLLFLLGTAWLWAKARRYKMWLLGNAAVIDKRFPSTLIRYWAISILLALSVLVLLFIFYTAVYA